MKKSEKFANLILGFLLAIVGLLFVYFIAKHLRGIPTSNTIYAALIATFVLLLAIIKFLPENIKINLALLGLTSLLIVYALEAFLHIYGNPLDYRTPNFIAARMQQVPFDKRTPLQIVQQMRSEGIDAYPYVSPNQFIGQMPETEAGETIYVLGGISNVATVHCNETGTYTIYQSDRYGFHNMDAIWDEETLDVVALGDSFTQGACVQTQENYVSLIREEIPKTLNLGASGNGPLGALATLKEYAIKQRPKHVLWFYFEGNDMGDFLAEVSNQTLVRYVEDDFTQNLVERQDDVNYVRGEYVQAVMAGISGIVRRERIDTLRLYNVRRLLRLTREPISEENSVTIPLGPPREVGQDAATGAMTDSAADAPTNAAATEDADAQASAVSVQSGAQQDDTPTCTWNFAPQPETIQLETDVPLVYDLAVYDPAMEIGLENLVQVAAYMRELVASWGGELTVVYLPDYMRFYPQNPADVNANYRLCVIEAFERADVDLLDLLPVFEAYPDPLTLYPFGLYGHYSVEGNALVAESVLDHLETK